MYPHELPYYYRLTFEFRCAILSFILEIGIMYSQSHITCMQKTVIISLCLMLGASLAAPVASAQSTKGQGDFCQRLDQKTTKKLDHVAKREQKINNKITRLSAKQAKKIAKADKQAKSNAKLQARLERREAVQSAIANYKAAIESAIVQAKTDCAKNVASTSVRATYKNSIKAAQNTLKAALKATK